MIKNILKTRIKTSIALFILAYLLIVYKFISTYVLFVFSVLSLIEFFQISNKIFNKRYLRYFINSVFIIYFSFFCYFFILFSNLIYLKVVLYTVLFGCVASDIGGFIFGKIFKGPKLTKISPNKTYAGALVNYIYMYYCFIIFIFFY